jgi:Rap1a immunity proteins
MTYIRGFVDGIAIGTAAAEVGALCAPDKGISPTQARLIFEKYVRDHPDRLSGEAGLVMGEALISTFPCRKK